MKTEIDGRRCEHMDALRRVLVSMHRATRAQLAEATGLSAMTVGKLLAVMQERGEVYQKDTLRLSGGRPCVIAQYNGDFLHFAVVSVEQREGKSAFTLSIYNLFGEPVLSEELLMEQVCPDSFDAFFEQAQVQGYRLALCVFVLPGVADGESIVLCDLNALVGDVFLPRLKERFGLEILFENDVNGAVLGHAFDVGKDDACVGIYFPRTYCPGAGVVIGDRILHGNRHFAGEISCIQGEETWLALDYTDEQCVIDMIGQSLVMYACTIAPHSVVLYGDFFTPDIEHGLHRYLHMRLKGRFDMEIFCRSSMAADMERGAVKLGLKRMHKILSRMDKDQKEN